MSDDKALSAGDWFFGKVLHMGANWQTTLSGVSASIVAVLTMIAALPYEFGELADILSPEWKHKVVIAGLIATGALKIWNAISQKSKNVTGGNTQQTLGGDLAKPGTQTLVDLTKQTPPA